MSRVSERSLEERRALGAAKSRAWYAANREWANTRRRAAYAAKTEDEKAKVRAAGRAWRAANPAKAKERKRAWQAANLDKHSVHQARRYVRKMNAAVPLTAAEEARIEAIYAEAKRRTKETGEQHHVDHDVPLARGGKHHPDNLLVVPASMNLKKGAHYACMWDFISS